MIWKKKNIVLKHIYRISILSHLTTLCSTLQLKIKNVFPIVNSKVQSGDNVGEPCTQKLTLMFC